MKNIKLNDYNNFIISEFITEKLLKYSKYPQIDAIMMHSYINNNTTDTTIELILVLDYLKKDGTIINDTTKFNKKEIIPGTDILLNVTETNAIDFTYNINNHIQLLNAMYAAESTLLKDSKDKDNYYSEYIEYMKNNIEPFNNSIYYDPELYIPKIKTKKH